MQLEGHPLRQLYPYQGLPVFITQNKGHDSKGSKHNGKQKISPQDSDVKPQSDLHPQPLAFQRPRTTTAKLLMFYVSLGITIMAEP